MISLSGMPLVEWLIAWALVIVVPLGTRSPWLAASGALAALSFFTRDGAFLVVPYVVVVFGEALFALKRALERGVHVATLEDIGRMQLAVGATWLLASRAEIDTGYDAAITALTAAHFHYAGFATATVASRVLDRVGPTALVVGLGPGIVGIGIAVSPTLELLAACTLALGMVGLGVAMIRKDRRLVLPALPLLGTMALAIAWAVQEFLGGHALLMPTMAKWHGVGNALGFATLALFLTRTMSAPSRLLGPLTEPPAAPSAEATPGAEGPGLVASLTPFGLDRAPACIQRYHLEPESVILLLRPTWRPRWLGPLAHAITRRLGNFVLPHEDRVHRVTNQVTRLDATHVYSVRSTDYGPMFRLTYSTLGQTMRVQGDAGLGHLDIHLSAEGVDPHVLRSKAIFWVVGGWRIRLPLSEQLHGHAHQDQFLATQTFDLLGVEILRLRYVIAPEPQESFLA